MKLIVAPAARLELREAARWYEEQRRDLGDVSWKPLNVPSPGFVNAR